MFKSKKDYLLAVGNGILILLIIFLMAFLIKSLNSWSFLIFAPFIILIIEFLLLKFIMKSAKSISFYILSYVVWVVLIFIFLTIKHPCGIYKVCPTFS